jgi:PKHD-type hydroxylase
MQYMLTPYAEAREPFAWWEGAFNEPQLNWLQQQARNSQQKAGVGGGGAGGVDPSIRRSDLNWLPNTPETQWVFETLGHVVLTNYNSSEHGMYGWHVDMGPNTTSPCRKLSIVVQLSDPVDYEGGVLELQPSGSNVVRMRKQRGLVVAFPSWTLHQVTPVTQGDRQSLVAWISGPPFK